MGGPPDMISTRLVIVVFSKSVFGHSNFQKDGSAEADVTASDRPKARNIRLNKKTPSRQLPGGCLKNSRLHSPCARRCVSDLLGDCDHFHHIRRSDNRPVAACAQLDRVNNVHASGNTANNRVLTVQEIAIVKHDKKLAVC